MADGMVGADTSIYNKLMGAGGQQQIDPMQMIGQMQQLQGQKIGLDNATLDQQQKHFQFLADRITPLIAMGDKVTPEAISQAATQAVADSKGQVSPDEAMRFVTGVQTFPGGMQAGLQKAMNTTLQGMDRIRAMSGNPGWVNNGTSLQATSTNVYDNSVNRAGGNSNNVQVYPSRADMAGRDTVGYGKTGAPIAGTTQQRLQAQGAGGLISPDIQGRPGGGPLAGAFRQPGAAAPNVGPVAGATGAPVAAGAPAATAAPTPGPQEVPMEMPVKAYQEDLQNSTAKMQGLQPLLQAIPLVQALGPGGTGPTSGAMNDMRKLLITRGVIDANTPDDQSAMRDQVEKKLKQYAGSSGVAGAGGSDYRTAFASSSNPNLDTTQKATLALARTAVAYDRMEAARPLAFADDPNANINKYGNHKAGWIQSQDPRAYGLDTMEPPVAQKLVSDMQTKLTSSKAADKQEAQRFFMSLHNADKYSGFGNAGH